MSIDKEKMQLVLERLQTTQSASEDAAKKFLDILQALKDLLEKIDGYPQMSVERMDQLKCQVGSMEKGFNDFFLTATSTLVPPPDPSAKLWRRCWSSFAWAFLGSLIGSGIIALFILNLIS